MKGYIFVCEKGRGQSNSNAIHGIFSQYFGKEITLNEYSNENLFFYNFTNEPKEIQYSYPPYQFGVAGDFLEEENMIFNGFLSSRDQDLYISNLGGIFSFAVLHQNRFTLWNNVTRVEPVYWCETPERIVVGTKALPVHLLALGINRPEYNINNFTSFLNNGFYCDDKTPYKGVQVLERNSRLEIINNKLTIRQIDDFNSQLYSLEPDNTYYDEITQLFIDTFKALKKYDVNYTMGLTGGKDSRLVVAAMHRLGLDVNTVTNGFEDTPDVVIGSQIAQLLQIPHKINLPSKGQPVMNVNLHERTVNVLRNTEGMLFSYENISGISQTFNPDKIQLGGQGGELFRGGYAKKVNITSGKELHNHLRSGFSRYGELIHEDALNNYHNFLYQFAEEQPDHLNYNDVLNSFYLSYRCGRWSGTSRSAYTMGFHSYAPLFESRLVKKAQLLKTKYGANEQLIYNILLRIAPELTTVPFAEDRWAFEKQHPYSRHDVENWINRKPLYSHTQRGSFNWRKNVLVNFKKQFQEIIFADENSPLFDIVNKEALRGLFIKKGNNLAKYDTFLWCLYSSSVLLSNKWIDISTENSRVSIKIPESTSVTKSGVLTDITLIPGETLKASNPKVKMGLLSTISSTVEWNQYQKDDRLYFQTFDNPFASPPSEHFKPFSAIKGTELEFHFEIEKYDANDFSLDLYIIQYDKEKKVKSERVTHRIIDQQKMYSFKVAIHPNAVSCKYVFMIKDGAADGRFGLHQMRVHTYC
jgi:asparagine synthetase B (glutamine-hydrolysing)